MKLDMRFSSRPLEALWSEAVVALVYRTPDIASGPLAGLNDKTIGTLKRLLTSGNWTGDQGEKILIATQNMIMADKLLLYGLGNPWDLNGPGLSREMRKVGEAIDKIGVRDFGILIPPPESTDLKIHTHLERALKNITEAFIARHENDSDYHLKMIVFVEDSHIHIISGIVEKLRENFSRISDLSIINNERQRSLAA